MKGTVFGRHTLMVVDDDKLTRVTLLRLFKNLGDPEVHCAENGSEALSILEQRNQQIDCVLLDFNMPVIHGLQMLKLIRSGMKKIRRNMPVALLTGYGEPTLVKLAMELDANTFVLKPVSKDVLVPRLQEILCIDRDDYTWIKTPEDYLKIDVDCPIADILEANAKSQIASKDLYKGEVQVSDAEWEECFIDDLEEKQVLSRHVTGSDDILYFPAETTVTTKIIARLRDLHAMKLIGETVFLKPR